MKQQHPGKSLRLFVCDEARIGQQGTLTRVWAPTGSRPTLIKQCEYQWLYLWGAVDPMNGDSIAMITPTVDTQLMQTFIDGLSGHVQTDEHAVLVLDNAGWHVANALRVPSNITLLLLPPYAPELNPVERLWAWLRSHHLSNRIYADYADLLNQTDRAWLTLDKPTLQSVCNCPWLERAIQT